MSFLGSKASPPLRGVSWVIQTGLCRKNENICDSDQSSNMDVMCVTGTFVWHQEPIESWQQKATCQLTRTLEHSAKAAYRPFDRDNELNSLTKQIPGWKQSLQLYTLVFNKQTNSRCTDHWETWTARKSRGTSRTSYFLVLHRTSWYFTVLLRTFPYFSVHPFSKQNKGLLLLRNIKNSISKN